MPFRELWKHSIVLAVESIDPYKHIFPLINSSFCLKRGECLPCNNLLHFHFRFYLYNQTILDKYFSIVLCAINMLLHLISAHDKITDIDLWSLWIKTILCFYSLFKCLVHCKVPVSFQNAVELAIIPIVYHCIISYRGPCKF